MRDRTIRKLYKRIVLFAFICFIVNYVDRVNIGFAALHMNEHLGLTPSSSGSGQEYSSPNTWRSRFQAT